MAPTHDHPGEYAADDPVRLLAIRDTPLSVDEVFRAVGDDAAGGIALFVGTVRNHDGGQDVGALGYSCHPSAENELRKVAEKVVADFPVRALAAVHRVGELAVGDLAVVVAVACPPPRRGVRRLPQAHRRPQARGSDLEAPAVLGRYGGMGRSLLIANRTEAHQPRFA